MNTLTREDEKPLAILLSVFNGERFLREQLKSIADQGYREWCILWRDDGSSDQSRAIMEEFSAGVGHGRCVEVRSSCLRLGASKSFLSLLREADGYPFVAFADQDDVWLPTKLERAVAYLRGIAETTPALYCGRQIVVDKCLKQKRFSPLPRFGLHFPSALLQNVVTGCTAVLNQEGCRRVNGIFPPEQTMHDWWIYIVIAAVEGSIYFDPAPEILYRQHSSNAVGVAPNLFIRLQKAIRRGARPFFHQLSAHLSALECAAELLPDSAQQNIAAIRDGLHQNRLRRLHFLRHNKQFRRQTWLDNAALALWVLSGDPIQTMYSNSEKNP